jgi:hypothetical protein
LQRNLALPSETGPRGGGLRLAHSLDATTGGDSGRMAESWGVIPPCPLRSPGPGLPPSWFVITGRQEEPSPGSIHHDAWERQGCTTERENSLSRNSWQPGFLAWDCGEQEMHSDSSTVVIFISFYCHSVVSNSRYHV